MKMKNTNYNYEKGAYTNIPITYEEASKTLTIKKREGKFDGMLINRTFKVIWITKAKPKELREQKADATVQYKGEAVIIKMK